MISFEEYRDIVSELMDELPDEFFRELSGGVVASEATVIPNYAQGNDLFTLGQYQVFSRVRQIAPSTGRIPKRTPTKRGGSFAASCGTRSGITWNPWAASTTLPPWRRRTSGRSRRTCRSMPILRNERASMGFMAFSS